MSLEKITDQERPQENPYNRETPEPQRPSDIINPFKVFDPFQSTGFHGGPRARRKGYRLALWSWLATCIDVLVLISLSCVFLLAFTWTFGTTLRQVVPAMGLQQPILILFFEVLLMLGWIYQVTLRSLLGFTCGEWACDLRLGQPHERMRTNYFLRVALRATLILGTGVVVLPVLSMVCGKDLAGSLTGLRLFSLK